MLRRKNFNQGFVIILAVVILMLLTSPAQALTVQDVEGYLICQCGCDKVVSNCVCAKADSFRNNIANLINQGKGKDEILQSFIANYGEAVLAEPVKQGFNWTAWILPFVALALGIAVVYLALRRWVLSGQGVSSGESREEIFIDEEERQYYNHRLEKDLKRNL